MGYYLTVPVHDLFFMNFPKPILLSKLHHLILSSSLCWSIHLWCTYYFRYYLFVLFVSFYPRHTSFLHLVSKFFFLFLDFIYLFLERGEGKEKERERNINVWLPLMCPLLGTWPVTQACALTGNQTRTLWFSGRPSIHWAMPARASFQVLRGKYYYFRFATLLGFRLT